MIGAVNQQNQNCESPDLSNIKIGQRFTEEQRKGTLAQFNFLKPSALTAEAPRHVPPRIPGGGMNKLPTVSNSLATKVSKISSQEPETIAKQSKTRKEVGTF